MSEAKDIPLEEIIGRPDDPPAAGHDEWFRKKVQETLDKKKRGEASYTPWEVVRKKFGI